MAVPVRGLLGALARGSLQAEELPLRTEHGPAQPVARPAGAPLTCEEDAERGKKGIPFSKARPLREAGACLLVSPLWARRRIRHPPKLGGCTWAPGFLGGARENGFQSATEGCF